MRPSRRWWRVALQRLHVLGRHQLRDQRWGPSGREPRTPRVVAARMQGRAGVGCDAAMKGQGGAGVAGEDVAITSPANHDHHMLPHTPAALSSPRSGSAMWRCGNATPRNGAPSRPHGPDHAGGALASAARVARGQGRCLTQPRVPRRRGTQLLGEVSKRVPRTSRAMASHVPAVGSVAPIA